MAAPKGVDELFDQVRSELARSRLPQSTYRVQLHRSFRFSDARAVVPYLSRLGVSTLYSSPCLAAQPGSTHGYDVVDHTRLNPELGSEAEHEELCAALAEHGMGLLQDFVPNHMGIERGNALWRDLLENGPSSRYAKFFDVDWDPVKEQLKNKVLLPILGDQYGAVLERAELRLAFADGGFEVRYQDLSFPVAPRAYRLLLGPGLEELERTLGRTDLDFIELQSVLTAVEHLPARTETEAEKVAERSREKEVVKRRLAALAERSAAIKSFIESSVATINGKVGDPRSFDRLDEVLSACCHRLAHWRVAGEEINYRRFFDINSLAAIRVEDPEVFSHTHQLLLRWLGEGKVTGVRIDHPDGLFDPTAYFLDLQESFFLERCRRRLLPRADEEWAELERPLRARFREEVRSDPNSPLRRSLYVVLEKIQGGRERIPDAWAVHGTTGYRFANSVGGVLVDRGQERAMTEVYQRFVGRSFDYRRLVVEKKRLVMSASMASEINVLARELNRISEMNRHTRDFTLNSLRKALVELIALFPVYRTYVDDWRPEVDERDVQYIEWTIARAKQEDPSINVSIFDFLRDVLLRRYPEHVDERERKVMLRFAQKLQQVTGPVMAKGVEDTAFYVYNRLISLNEVGGEPERFGTAVATFHLRNQERVESWPASLLCTSTHDTKRSEDVRARLHVLSELPSEWEERVQAFSRLCQRHKSWVEEWLAPDRNEEYHFYQTVVGAWPMGGPLDEAGLESFRLRLRDYMLKAVREAKVNSSWVNPDRAYEAAVERFVEGCLDPKSGGELVEEAFRFKRRIERPGQLNSLSQVLLKAASPGTADFYQGCELWNLSLVDPDNRRPVDYELRWRLLEELDRAAERDREGLCRELFAELDDGRAKLYLTAQALRLRRRMGALFNTGAYLPLDFGGPRSSHLVGLCRRGPEGWAVAVAPRLVVHLLNGRGGLSGAFSGTFAELPEELSGKALRDVFTGRAHRPERGAGMSRLMASELLSAFPVALLYGEDSLEGRPPLQRGE
ncbi:MAG: malto-oligosyltrehalose synthase [Myxococcales bacterium]|nr:malto-oligosyltrehalose synthase [Myxococcales bacterium]